MTENLDLESRRTALVAMDYQVGLLRRLPDAEALVPRVDDLAGRLRAAGGTVAWVRMAFTEADLAAVRETSALAASASARSGGADLLADAPATQLHPGFHVDAADVQVRKTRVGVHHHRPRPAAAGPRHRHGRPGGHRHQRRRAEHHARGRRPRLPHRRGG